jgi:hypothetical protein
VEFIQAGNVEYMMQLQRNMGGYNKNCVQKLRDWKDAYAIVLDVSVETALKGKLTKYKQDLLEYKRSALDKQVSLPAAVVPQPTSAAGQGDQLAKYLKQEAKGKMMALYNKLKNNCEGIKGDASIDEL